MPVLAKPAVQQQMTGVIRYKSKPRPFRVLSCRSGFSEVINFVESKRDMSNSNKHESPAKRLPQLQQTTH
jgi:hypothetical protein